ncbi:hypothetical protein INT43_007385 [Umbelopsis isabellina]|uniref:Vezatin n=1 Tax=Mortierella isabellina TaxID=91625 RepID=A0A8H7PYY7_MORIS|nr:hypothetical protein INT43_007385 [Umbelopsis isabellina]
MSEIVVYEDTPFAEYIQEIEGSEYVVSQEQSRSPTLLNNLRAIAYDYWTNYSMGKDFATSHLPRAEQLAFTEEFKYVIVTSSLLNERMSVRSKSIGRANDTTKPDISKVSQIWDVAGYALSMLLLIGANRKTVQHWQSFGQVAPVAVTSTISLSATFMVYRNIRRMSLRQTHSTALGHIKQLIRQCRLLDSKVNRIINMIQEIELVSRGYRITKPLSPISRIEQNSKIRRCEETRKKLYILLSRAILKFDESIVALTPLVDDSTVLHLYDLYYAHSDVETYASYREPAIIDQHEDKFTLEHLKHTCLSMHLRRRQFLVHLLSLRAVNTSRKVPNHTYRREWVQIQQEIGNLAEEVENIALESTDILNELLYKSTSDESQQERNTKHQSETNSFMRQLDALQLQLRTLQAKMFLCQEDAAKVRQDGDEESSEQLKQQFASMAKDLDLMMKEWEQGQQALHQMLSPEEVQTITQPDHTMNKGSSANIDDVTNDGSIAIEKLNIIGSDEHFDQLPAPSRAQVFETVAEMGPTNLPKSKLSRAERIRQVKEQREVEAKVRSEKADSQKMVHELKDVLGRRLADLDLDQE